MDKRLDMLLTQAELAIAAIRRERDGKRTAALRRLLRVVLQLNARRTLNDQLRDAFCQAFVESAYGSDAIVQRDEAVKDVVTVDGSFDLSELAKRLTW